MVSLLRLKRKIEKNWIYIGMSVLAIIIIISLVLILKPNKETEENGKYEITEVDLFSIKNFTSRDVSVKGIKLGDEFNYVIEKLGYPNSQADYPPNIMNVEYSSNMDMNGTGLILNFENNILRRISFREPFNKYLVGKTKIQYTKDEVYQVFGKPDDTQFIQTNKASPVVFRNMVYNQSGLGILVRGPKQIGFSLSY